LRGGETTGTAVPGRAFRPLAEAIAEGPQAQVRLHEPKNAPRVGPEGTGLAFERPALCVPTFACRLPPVAYVLWGMQCAMCTSLGASSSLQG
jgi:hypothetical protein